MRHLRTVTLLIGVWFLCLGGLPLAAHASLIRSEPPVGTPLGQLASARLRVSDVDPPTAAIRFATDVGQSIDTTDPSLVSSETVAADAVLIRWLNLLSLSILMGTLGFALFVWQPVSPAGQTPIDHLLDRLLLAGWLLTGITSVLMLVLQASVALDTSLLGVSIYPGLLDVVTASTFGSLWLMRMALWGIGLLLLLRPQRRKRLPLLLVLGMGILLTHSLFSHATATPDALAAVAGDWLHLLGATLWIGGLLAFGLVLARVREQGPGLSARMVGYFSNYARIAGAALIFTGIYAAWLHVG
ncbi:MAG: hypothetical protein KC547_18280, partial [Anaerolineae bacterium]|nr:hypothetical protein [Anaerolineae bacterium]